MREIATALAVTIVAAVLSAGGWLLMFSQFAIVPDGVTYPVNWLSLTSGEQVDWLRTHTVVLTGFDASVYMLTHFSKYSFQLLSMLGIAWAAAAIAVGARWHLKREDVGKGANVECYSTHLQDNDR